MKHTRISFLTLLIYLTFGKYGFLKMLITNMNYRNKKKEMAETIWPIKIEIDVREIRHMEIFKVADVKTRDVKIP